MANLSLFLFAKVTFFCVLHFTSVYGIQTVLYRNSCGKNQFYANSSPLKVFLTLSVSECASFCLRSERCKSFNAIKGSEELLKCEFFDQKPDCSDLQQQDRSLFYKKVIRQDSVTTAATDTTVDQLTTEVMTTTISCSPGFIPNGTNCVCPNGMFGTTCSSKHRDCASHATEGNTSPAHQVLYIWPDSYPEAFLVKCFLLYGGLTYIQQNQDDPLCNPNDPHDYFNRDWTSYKTGFGDFNCKFWLGLDRIHALTAQKSYMLTIEIWPEGESYKQGYYGDFTVGTEAEGYPVGMTWFSNHPDKPIGDSLLNPAATTESIKGQKFSTFDNDNDNSISNCAADFQAGFWFNDCAAANPNGWLVSTSDGTRNTSVPSILWKYDLGHKAIKYVNLKLT